MGAGALAAVGGGVYAAEIEPFWVQFSAHDMPLRRLPRGFEGMRLVHLSDLHASAIVPMDYLRDVMDRVNQLEPDVVVVTGDLITHGAKHIPSAADVLAMLNCDTFVTLGNHDYGTAHPDGGDTRTMRRLTGALSAHGIRVLSNESVTIERGGGRLHLVGLDDIWARRFDPEKAFADVPDDEPAIALSHNPDTAAALKDYPCQWILSGHTHGGQVRVPGYGALVLPTSRKEWDQGLFDVDGTWLYVSRGVGYIRRVRFGCRPEVAVFTLRRAEE